MFIIGGKMFNFIVSGKEYKKVMGILPYLNNHIIYSDDWVKNLEFRKLFNFTTLKKIKSNTKYVVYINYYRNFFDKDFNPLHNFISNGRNFKISIPEQVKQDSQNGLVHWLIDYNTECHQQSINTNLLELSKQLYALPKNITLITGAETQGIIGNKTKNFAKQHGYNVITGYELFNFLDLDNQKSEHERYVDKKLKEILDGTELKYKSLCYNRLPRPHRTVVVAHIIKNQYSESCLYSLGTFPTGKKRWSWAEHFPELEKIIKDLEKGTDIYPHIKENKVNLSQNQAHTLGWEHGLNSYFQFVTETAPESDRFPFITEKSLKPFAMLQPFVQYGPQNNVKNLQTYGFDIFDQWIDHSYDTEENDIKRLNLVLKEFDRLQNISNKNWAEMLKEMTSSLLHNLQLIKKPPIRNFSSQLIPILYDFIKDD